VTFNGRGFDFPLILNRALTHGIRPPGNFLRAAFGYRYRPDTHIDLMDLFTLFGAGTRFSLSAYCIGQGVESPKQHGSGSDVLGWVRGKDLDSLVRYSLADTVATAALYENWTETIDYSFGRT
jgi:DNA polymerase elongation subunit (family B)